MVSPTQVRGGGAALHWPRDGLPAVVLLRFVEWLHFPEEGIPDKWHQETDTPTFQTAIVREPGFLVPTTGLPTIRDY
jgi:hypothetical protein